MPSSLSSPFSPGGGLRLCGCLWRIASDDLVITAWLEFFVRLVMLAVVIGVLAFEEITDFSCAKEFHLDYYLFVAVALFSVTLANLLLLACESAKGSIWDSDPDVRRMVVPLVYFNIALTVVELGWVVVGTLWVVRGLMATCVKPGDVVVTDIPLYAISGVVFMTWVGLGIKVLVTCLGFNTVEWRRRPVDLDETIVRIDAAPPATSLRSKFFSLCMQKTHISFFRDVANVLSFVFDDVAFVPTDIAAALILLYAKQESKTQQRREANFVTNGRGDNAAEAAAPLRKHSPTFSQLVSRGRRQRRRPRGRGQRER